MPIHFGTDGWRGVISDTFTFLNLRLVTQAIADAVASEEWLNGEFNGPMPDSCRMVVGGSNFDFSSFITFAFKKKA